MQPKPFPPEKRVALAQKPFEEVELFFHELPRSLQEEIVSDKRPGFRQGSPAGRRVNLQHLWADAKKPESTHYEKAWSTFGRIWHAWVVSQSPLQTLLEKFDNSHDFQNSTPSTPNTALDIECFRYLAVASIKGAINQEIIQKFYSFGYFQKDSIIESYIYLARSSLEIQQKNNLIDALKSFEHMRREFQLFSQEIGKILDGKHFSEILKPLEDSLKSYEEKVCYIQNIISDLLIIPSQISSFEKNLTALDKSIGHTLQEQQGIIEKIINNIQKQAEDIELLSVMADDGTRALEELRSSWPSLSTTPLVPLTSPDTVPSGLHHLESVSPTTPPIYHCDEFLRHRLLPTLETWLPEITPRWAALFHHAVWGCRWVLVPNPAWAVAYQEAIGETAQLHIVQVEPTWLCFADAWRVVAPAWQAAQQQPDCLHLLLFEDVNRALPECWARPWLDMVAGFRKVLPVEGQPAWPVNLRILACLASDQAALPLSKTVIQHWAAVSLRPVGQRTSEAAQLQVGHVPWAAWQSWGTGAETATVTGRTVVSGDRHDVSMDWSQFGYLAHSVARDRCRLEASLRSVDPDIDTALQTVKNVRSTWPQEYLFAQEAMDE
ncbi:MAG: hypothetical protein AB7N91_29050 [Candidatus Tectimicrobiota bacterium]